MANESASVRSGPANITLVTLGLTALCLAPPARAAAPVATIDLATMTTAADLRRVHGSQGNGNRGVPVTGGFDVDGDTFADIAMASMQASPQGRASAGIVYVAFGDGTISGTLDTATPQAGILEIHGAITQENAGSEIWMDDVTGDGLGDLLIARQNFTPDAGRIGAGALTILVGSAAVRTHAATLTPVDLSSPPPALTLTTFLGADELNRLGMWMRTGDVTGDGIADIVVGADQAESDGDTHAGRAWVIRGGAHLATTQTIDLMDFGTTVLAGHIARLDPPSSSTEAHFGATCAIGDLDGNGRAEVLVAATLNRAGGVLAALGAPPGSAHGAGGTPDGTLYITWDDNFPSGTWTAGLTIDASSPPGTATIIDGADDDISFGEEILAGLDYDDDGSADLFVGDLVGDGTPGGGRPTSGIGWVIYDADSLKGMTVDMDTLPPGTITTKIVGPEPGDIAADTAEHGDFDGDGIDDLAFSSPHGSPLGRPDAGIIHVFFGQSTPWPAFIDLAAGSHPDPSLVQIVEVYGANGTSGLDTGDILSYSGAAGDIDGDGRMDIITNEMEGNGIAPAARDVGNVIVLSGAHLAPPPPICGETPRNDCQASAVLRSFIQIKERANDGRDRIKWVWRGGPLPMAELQNPLTGSPRYALCLYDGSAAPQPAAQLDIAAPGCAPTGTCWRAAGTSGFTYRDRNGTSDGVVRARLKSSLGSSARLLVVGRGPDTPIPTLPITPPLRAQLVVDDGTTSSCWESTFATPVRNDASDFRAKGS